MPCLENYEKILLQQQRTANISHENNNNQYWRILTHNFFDDCPNHSACCWLSKRCVVSN